MQQVRPERSGWRDQALSERHRQWGWDLPCLDIDCMFIEYNNGKAAAIVEYKNENAAPINPDHPSIRAMIGLANNSDIPAYLVRYATDFSWFKVHSLNGFGKKYLIHDGHNVEQVQMDETGYIALMHEVRGLKPPNQESLDDILFPEVKSEVAEHGTETR